MKNNNHVIVVTMGCSKNLVDSERLLKQFQVYGYQVGHDTEVIPKGASVIVNTCGFIGDAKEESIDAILDYVALKNSGEISRLYVMGCLSERYQKELETEIPEVDRFFGKFDWAEVLNEMGHTWKNEYDLDRYVTTPKHYAYLKISEGCSRTCAYCAIPLITGGHKSKSMDDIVEEAEMLVKGGVKELQLIAQDLSYYGLDLYKKNCLAALVERLANIQNVSWIRLHYTYPAEFPVDLLKVMREQPKVCAYLDMALQHISDNMLKRMRRNITKEETLRLLQKIREEVPGIHLRTTLMVGYPGETEADFEELCAFVQTFKFDRMGAFAYSEEEGTYAAKKYADDVPFEIKQQRLDKLMRIQQEVSDALNQQKIGQTLNVLIDREEPDYFVGRTEYDSPEVDPEVFVEKDASIQIGAFYPIQITSTIDYDLVGQLDSK